MEVKAGIIILFQAKTAETDEKGEKNMKRRMTILLALAMLLCLAACTDKDDTENPNPGTIASGTQETEPPYLGFATGSVEGYEYRNESLGIGYTLKDGGMTYSEKTFRPLLKNYVEAFDGEAAGRLNDLTLDFYAQEAGSAGSIFVLAENMAEKYGKRMTGDEYAEMILPYITQARAADGITDIETSRSTCAFAGQDRSAVDVVFRYNGYEYYEKMILIAVEDHMVMVLAQSNDREETDGMLSGFYALEK